MTPSASGFDSSVIHGVRLWLWRGSLCVPSSGETFWWSRLPSTRWGWRFMWSLPRFQWVDHFVLSLLLSLLLRLLFEGIWLPRTLVWLPVFFSPRVWTLCRGCRDGRLLTSACHGEGDRALAVLRRLRIFLSRRGVVLPSCGCRKARGFSWAVRG